MDKYFFLHNHVCVSHYMSMSSSYYMCKASDMCILCCLVYTTVWLYEKVCTYAELLIIKSSCTAYRIVYIEILVCAT